MHAKQAFLLRERAIFPGSGSSCALASCPRGEGFPDMSGPPYGSKTDAKQAEPGSDMVNSCVCISDPHFAESRAFSCKRLGENVQKTAPFAIRLEKPNSAVISAKSLFTLFLL